MRLAARKNGETKHKTKKNREMRHKTKNKWGVKTQEKKRGDETQDKTNWETRRETKKLVRRGARQKKNGETRCIMKKKIWRQDAR